MFWNILFAIGAFVLQLLLIPKPQNAKAAALEDFDFPTAEEGREIPVVFGTVILKGPNVVWYGDYQAKPIYGPRRYLLFGPRQVTGYKYYLGIHMVLCHGVLDNISQIKISEKVLYQGNMIGGRTYTIYKPGLLGKSAGGVEGRLSCWDGNPNQGQSSYLQGVLGTNIPAFRGVVGIVLHKMYLGKSEYIQPWSFKVQRIHKQWDNTTQWYDGKSAMGSFAGEEGFICIVMDRNNNNMAPTGTFDAMKSAIVDTLEILQSFNTGNVSVGIASYNNITNNFGTYLNASYADFNTMIGAINATSASTPIGSPVTPIDRMMAGFYSFFQNAEDDEAKTMIILNHTEPDGGDSETNIEKAEDYRDQYDDFEGLKVNLIHITEDDEPLTETYDIIDNSGGTEILNDPDNILATMSLAYSSNYDMNPAHIIRECLTDKVWGMGYNSTDLDDDSFTAAADQLFAENFGLSFIWYREETIEEFITMVITHIDAVLYTSRSTGKFVLKLIRDDYDINDIPVITEDDVVSWEEVKRRSPAESVNYMIVKYYDRENEKDGSITIPNIAQIQQIGGIISTTRTYQGINRGDLAARVGLRDLRSLQIGHFSGTIKTKRLSELNPGDPFRLLSDDQDLSGEVMRVTELDLGDGRQNEMTIKFAQDTFYLSDDVLAEPPETEWDTPFADPTATTDDAVEEMTYYELLDFIGQLQLDESLTTDTDFGMLRCAARAPQDNAINATVIVDGVESDDMEYCPGGILSSALSVSATSFTIYNERSLEDVVVGTLVYCEGELMRLDTIDDETGACTVGRGILDTIPAAHAANAPVLFISDYQYTNSEGYTATDAFNVNLLTNTTNGQLLIGDSDLDQVEFDSRAFRPYRPANITVGGQSYPTVYDASDDANVAVTWARRNRLTVGTLLDWEDADESPEYDQTTVIEVYDLGYNLLTTHSGLTGTSFNIPIGSFGGNSIGYVRIMSERDGYRSFNYWETQVYVGSGYGYAYGYNYGGA